jgi:hypothetical protein
MIELIHTAHWKDQPFPCMSVDTDDGNALVLTSYPHRDGQHARSHGRLGKRWTTEVVFSPDFNGRGEYPADHWPHGYLRFLESLHEKERAYFDHPLHGRAWAMCSTWREHVDNRSKETAYLTVNWEEANLDEPSYDLVLGDPSVTTDGAMARAELIDVELGRIYYPDIVGEIFAAIWHAYFLATAASGRILSYDDMVCSVNMFHLQVAAAIADYPMILDPLNHNVYAQIMFLRRDATVIAQRYSGEGKRITTWTNRVERTALECAVYLYHDTSRESEFLALNGSIKNPNRVSPGTYRIYSDVYPGVRI